MIPRTMPDEEGLHMTRIAVIDDWQGVARASADWSALMQRADVAFFEEPFRDADHLAATLQPFDVLVIMRERSHFPASVLERLPKLRMIAVTGARTWTLDLATCNARGIVVSHTGGQQSTAATAELTLGLLLAATRYIPRADANMRAGGFQNGVPVGFVLEGRTLGIIGLGKIGGKLARYGQALGMNVIAWSPHLTAEK